MPHLDHHFHLPHFHIHRKRHTHGPPRSADVEAGRTTITAPTNIRQIDNVVDDPRGYNVQRTDSLGEAVKTYRTTPIFSGIMITFSIMLSIPGLTGHWYVQTNDNAIIDIQPSPVGLDVALGFGMAFLILATVCLVVRFAERWVKQMTLASISLLTLHDIINISIVTTFGVIHRFDDGFTYGQSFWFTVCATVVSTAANITLIVDYITTKDFATSGSGLTSKQRSLVIIAMVLLSYISIGAVIESKLLEISYLNALYFSVVTLETIGFGDFYPTTPGAKVFTCFFIVGGILNIALAVAVARDVVVESAVVEFQERLAVQKHERRLRSRWRAAVRWRLKDRGLPVWIHHHRHGLPGEHPHHDRWYDRLSRMFESLSRLLSRKQEDPAWKFQYGPRQRRLNIEALTDAEWNAAALETGAPLSKLVPEELRVRRQESVQRSRGESLSNRPTIDAQDQPASPSLTHFRLGGMLAIVGNFALAVSQDNTQDTDSNTTTQQPGAPNTALDEKSHEDESSSLKGAPNGVPLTLSSTSSEDDHMEPNLEADAKQMFGFRLLLAFSIFFVFWMSGSAIFMKTENWTFWSSAYFCFVSFTTLGYGDFSPKSPAGMSIFVVWALLGVGTMTILISVIMEGFSQRYQHAIKSETAPTPRTPAEYPTFTNGGIPGLYSPSSPRGILGNQNPLPETARSIRIQEKTPEGPADSTMNDDPRPLQSVLVQVDHLKSLITMARSQCDSEHFENLISYLEKILRDLEGPSTEET